MRTRALEVVRRVPGIDFIALAIRGKKVGFDKVIKMIDAMAATLKKEQEDDERKRDFCNKKLDEADDQKKAQERALSDGETEIAKIAESIESAKADIETLKTEIKDLDESVAEAARLRKEDNDEYKA